ncbi:hypothetical protein MAR_015368, partial [Mya arenaria]
MFCKSRAWPNFGAESMYVAGDKLEGCEASTRPDDQYGVAYDYRDQMAQATCTALLDKGGAHVYAVRRACSSLTVPCAEVCSSLSLTCFNSLHVYTPDTWLPRGVTGQKSTHMYRYNGCGGGCGPNFCCCRSRGACKSRTWPKSGTESVYVAGEILEELLNMVKRQWGSWSEWSACAFKYKGRDIDNGRTQNRKRILMEDTVAIQNETERRPCNAVQYA